MKKYLYIAASIVLLLLILLFVPGITSHSLNPFQKTSIATRTTQHIETIKISTFNSARYRYKSIFPYDFIYGNPSWGALLFKGENYLTEEERHNRDFYNMCWEMGIDLSRNNHFFTITTVATAGLDLGRYLKDPIKFTDEDSGLIVLQTPKAEIISLEIEDTLKEEDYPSIEITPGQWQQLITKLLPTIEKEIRATGLVESADKGSRTFIEKLFISIGRNRVEFK